MKDLVPEINPFKWKLLGKYLSKINSIDICFDMKFLHDNLLMYIYIYLYYLLEG